MSPGSTTQTLLFASVATAVSVLGAAWYQKRARNKIPSKWEEIGTVEKLYIYPVKSGRKIELKRAECTEVGLKQTKEDSKILELRDRVFMVYGSVDKEFRTIRTYPKMVLIEISVHDANHFALDAPTMRTLYVKIPNKTENEITQVKCWYNERIQAIDCGDEAAAWISRYLIERDSGLRLAYNDASRPRDITRTHQKLLNYYKNLGNQDVGLFSDLSSVSVINQSSIKDLNQIIGNSAITADNFRPNIVIDGPNMGPYDEDKWDWIKIGNETVFRSVKETTRCSLVIVDPNTGKRHVYREPLRTLQLYRNANGPEKAPVMGLYLGVRKTGIINAGDPVYVVRKEVT